METNVRQHHCNTGTNAWTAPSDAWREQNAFYICLVPHKSNIQEQKLIHGLLMTSHNMSAANPTVMPVHWQSLLQGRRTSIAVIHSDYSSSSS